VCVCFCAAVDSGGGGGGGGGWETVGVTARGMEVDFPRNDTAKRATPRGGIWIPPGGSYL